MSEEQQAEPNNDALHGEIERLREKNAELLNEVKRYKTRATEAEGALDTARNELTTIKLHQPVEDMLRDMFVVSPRLARLELEEHYQFALGEDGKVQVTDKQGQPLSLLPDATSDDPNPKARPAAFNAEDMRQAFVQAGKFDKILVGSRATGGGASGANRSSGAPAKTNEPAQNPAPAFGLR
ncbi:hypothetical protein [Pseudomonas oryzihabitans]|uniref:hypothetical protein n=1 Tax=Pseudomonas oryzihabitans TaxID=47885 RepID=UPI002898B592|nr:hypothetical protein [Pseudomonas oryzihabitans]